MYILGIGGSPRKGGNSDILLEKALEGARSAGSKTEKIILNDLSFKPCQECGGCDRTGSCVIRDDMVLVYTKVEEADALIIASPIFFGSLSAQTKAMIDRFQCAWIARNILKRPVAPGKRRSGAFLCTGAFAKAAFFENAKSVVRIFFATLDVRYAGETFCGGVDEKGSVRKRPEVIAKARAIGEGLARAHGAP